MEWIKLNKDGEIEFVSEECKLVPEVQTLLSLKYNKGSKDHDGRKRYRALDELKYMYLAYSPKSPYKDFYEDERIAEAKIDCNFSKEWKESEELKACIVKYSKGSVSKITRSLGTVEKFLEKFEKHLNSIDLNERNAGGGLVHDPAKVMATLGRLPDFLQTIQELERAAKNDIIASPKSKGDHELGWMAMNKNNVKPKQREEDESSEE
jgi:hypothetical protein